MAGILPFVFLPVMCLSPWEPIWDKDVQAWTFPSLAMVSCHENPEGHCCDINISEPAVKPIQGPVLIPGLCAADFPVSMNT